MNSFLDHLRGRSGFQIWLSLFCFAVFSAGGQTAADTNQPLATLTNAAQVLKLSRDEARRHYPVKVRGVVTFFDSRGELYFVQDETAGVYAYATNWGLSLTAGQRVELTGVSSYSSFTPYVLGAQTKVLGAGPPPVPRRVSVEEILTGRHECQWVEVEGVGRRAAEGWLYLALDIVSGNSRLKVRIHSQAKEDLQRLVNARVRLRGVAGANYDKQKKLTGFSLLVPGMDEVEVLKPADPNPFAAPLLMSTNLHGYSFSDMFEHRVRLHGVVTMHLPGSWIALRDAGGVVEVQTHQSEVFAPGTQVDATGFAGREPGANILEDAVARQTASGPAPPPVKISLGDTVTAEWESELVQLDANVVQSGSGTARRSLLVKSGPHLVNALLPSAGGDSFPALAAGSQVRLTGIYKLDSGVAGGPPALNLWLRTRADLLMIQAVQPVPAVHTKGAWLLAGLFLMGAAGVVLRMGRVEVVGARGASLGSATKLGEPWGLKPHSVREFVGLSLLGCGLFLAAVSLDAFELMIGWMRRNESWELDEIFVLAIILTWMFGIYSWRRWREIQKEVAIRHQVEAELREGEKQLRDLLEDRQRLGRDLHDGIIQSIYAIGLALEDCRRLVGSDPPLAQKRLAKSLADLNNVIRDVRNFISGLEPEALKGAEFRTALKSLVLTMNESGMANFVLHVDPLAADSLNSQQTVQLLHIAREAMSNSLRHGGAKTTVISLQRQKESIRFEVRDDGVGFEVAKVDAKGRGLGNIAARAKEIGARYEFDSRPGQGTRLTLDIPESPISPSNVGTRFT